VPAGGALGYVLTKASSADYNTIWSAPGGGGGTQVGLLKIPIASTHFNFATAVYSGTTAFTFTPGSSDTNTFTLGLATPSLPNIFINAYGYNVVLNVGTYSNYQRQFGPNNGTSSAVIKLNSSLTSITFEQINKTTLPCTANDSNGYCLYLYIMIV
jgi:hypothetical protein